MFEFTAKGQALTTTERPRDEEMRTFPCLETATGKEGALEASAQKKARRNMKSSILNGSPETVRALVYARGVGIGVLTSRDGDRKKTKRRLVSLTSTASLGNEKL